jgi:hypothetical protein
MIFGIVSLWQVANHSSGIIFKQKRRSCLQNNLRENCFPATNKKRSMAAWPLAQFGCIAVRPMAPSIGSGQLQAVMPHRHVNAFIQLMGAACTAVGRCIAEKIAVVAVNDRRKGANGGSSPLPVPAIIGDVGLALWLANLRRHYVFSVDCRG